MQHPDIPAGSPRARILNLILTADRLVQAWNELQETDGTLVSMKHGQDEMILDDLSDLRAAIEAISTVMEGIPEGWERLVIDEIRTQEDPDTL